MSQQNIDFGSFPDDPSADAIRTAFSKVQNNFDQLFDAGANAAVTSVNQTAGAGITVSSPTGNVVVSANIACVQVRTSTLSLGIGSNGNLSANYTSSGQLLYVDLPTNIQTTGNIQANGFIASNSNISASGNIAGGNLSTGGSLAVTGNANIGGNSDIGGNLVVSGSIVGNITGSASTAGTVTTAAQPNITSVGTLNGLSISGNIIPTANVTYDLGNTTNAFRDLYLSGTTIYIGNSTITANASGVTIATPGGSTVPLKAGGANTQVQYNDDGAFGGHPGMTFNEGTSTLTANNFVATSKANLGAVGNVTITGGTANYVLATNGSGNLTWVAQASGITGVSVQEEGTNVVATANTINFVGNGVTASNVGGVATVTISGSGTPGGANTQLQYNDDGIFGGHPGLTFDEGNSKLTANNFVATSTANLGNVANVTITGGTANYVLATDGAGNLSWANVAGGGAGNIAGGANTQVQYNDDGIFGGHPGMTFDEGNSRFTANNLVATSTANLGNVGNVTITGGNANFVLTTDGTGNLTWAEASTGNANVAGSNTQVQFNDDGVMGADANLTFDKTNGNLTVGSNVVAVNFIGSGANTPTILSGTNLDLIANSAVRVPSNISLYGPNVSLGDVANLHIIGGSNGQALVTDGNGVLSWASQTSGLTGVSVQEEGTNVVASANTINFVGNGVTASNVGGVATITIDSGNAEPAGNIYEIQYNSGAGTFAANNNFYYTQANGLYLNSNLNLMSSSEHYTKWSTNANSDPAWQLGVYTSAGSEAWELYGPNHEAAFTVFPTGNILFWNGFGGTGYSNGNANAGLTIGTDIRFINLGGNAPANGHAGIYFADGTYQYTAATGSAITIQEEGTNVVASANTINFVGNGVTASNVGGVATITISGSGSGAAAGNTTEVQFNTAGSFDADANFAYAQGGLWVGGVSTSGNAFGIITAKTDFRSGSWKPNRFSGDEDVFSRFRNQVVANSANTFYGFITDPQVVTQQSTVITNEAELTSAMVLNEGVAYNSVVPNAVGTIFGISVNNGYANGQPSTGTEPYWHKLMELNNFGNLGIGGNLTINPDWQYIIDQPANNEVGIVFADGTFQYTAATGTSITIQEEGTNVVASANTINFVGNGVTASNVGGVATITIDGGSNAVPGGSNTQLQFNDNGVFGGIPNVTYSNGNLSLGNVANVKMTGGTNGYYLQTDGSGNLTWATGSNYSGNGTVAGANTQIQFNDEGNFGAVAGFTFDKTTSVFTANNIVATSTADLGDVANVTILGGNTNYILTTDGSGSLSWANLSSNTFANSIAAAGANTQVQYNDDGVLGGNPGFTFDEGLSLVTANNFAATSTANLGDVANVYIGGGNALDVLATSDGNGTLAWATLTFMEAAGSNTQVQYNDDGVLGGNPAFTFDESNTLITANNLTVSSITNLGNVGNVHIDGGSNNYILTTDGSGNLNWSNLASNIFAIAAGGANTQIQYNDDGILGGSSAFTFDEGLTLITANNLTVSSITNLGNVSNVHIDGGSNSQVLTTDGSGNLSWANSGISSIAVQEEGTNVVASANTINFVGNGVTASNVGGVATVSINGISGITILEDANVVVITDTIGFTGPLVSVANVPGNIAEATIGLTIKDEGNVVTGNAIFGGLNFIGNGVTASADGNIANITIPGASIVVQEEGTNVVTNATIINFVGNGVTSSNVGGVATVTIAGSSESANANYANFAGTAFSVSGSNVSGEVANANYATYAGTAFSVDGGNISGEVANANYATYAGTAFSVDGANVNGEVANANYATYAGTAFSVDGANVNGEVANANYATYAGTAFSVSGSNVSGEVANANYATYAGTANTANTANSSGSANTVVINSMLGNTYYITGALNTSGSQTIHTTSLFSYDSNTNTLHAANANIGNVYGIIRPTSGTGTNGIIFPADPGGGSGDLATIQYYAATVEDTVLELTVTNDANDIIKLNATGGTTVTNKLTAGSLETIGNATIGNHLTVTTGGATITGNLDITGNINVTGNLNYSNVTDLVVGDPLIYLGANNTGNLYDLGLVASFNDGTYQHTGFARDHNDGIWKLFTNVVAEPTTVIDWANATFAPFTAGAISSNATISANGNITGSNLTTAGRVVATGNITGSQLISTVATGTAPLVVNSTTRVANLNVGYANVADFINVNTVSTGTFYPILANALSGNVEESANANLTFNASTGALSATLLTGTLTTNAQPNITSVGTLTGLNVNGTITAVNFTANTGIFTGNGSGLTNIQGSNITGNVTSAITANFANYAGNVTVASQSNITSLGTLTGLNVSGNASFTGSNVSLGAVGNLRITGGSNNYILTTDGSGNLSWSTGSNIANVKAGGVDTQIQYNDSGILGGNPGMTFNEGTTTLTANNFVASSRANLGSISNVYIGGGSPLQILATIDGAGNLAWATIETDNAAGSDTQVQYNDNGILGGNPGFTFNEGNTTVTANNFVASSRANLGAVGNVYIGGGNSGEILTTNGSGVLSWSNTISTTGNITVGNIIATGYHIRSVATGITALGTTQANAFALTKEFNLVTVVSSGTGVVLPTAVAGMAITIINKGSNQLNVYPAVNAAINSDSANAAYIQPVNGAIQYIALTSSQWYTVGGTYA